VEVNIAGTYGVAILEDVEVRDKAIIVLVAFGGVSSVFDECGDSILQFGNGALEPNNLRSMLRGMGLDGEGQTMDELAQLTGGDVGMTVEGCEDGTGRHRRGIRDGSSSRRGWDGVGRLGRQVNGI